VALEPAALLPDRVRSPRDLFVSDESVRVHGAHTSRCWSGVPSGEPLKFGWDKRRVSSRPR
jgi:hypothetical protein